MPSANALIPIPTKPDEPEDVSDFVMVPFPIGHNNYRNAGRRYLVWFDGHGQPNAKEVPGDACVVSGTSHIGLWTFLREFVAPECVPTAMSIVAQRSLHILKVGMPTAVKGWPGPRPTESWEPPR